MTKGVPADSTVADGTIDQTAVVTVSATETVHTIILQIPKVAMLGQSLSLSMNETKSKKVKIFIPLTTLPSLKT